MEPKSSGFGRQSYYSKLFGFPGGIMVCFHRWAGSLDGRSRCDRRGSGRLATLPTETRQWFCQSGSRHGWNLTTVTSWTDGERWDGEAGSSWSDCRAATVVAFEMTFVGSRNQGLCWTRFLDVLTCHCLPPPLLDSCFHPIQESLDQFEDALESLEHDPYERQPALQHLFFTFLCQ